MQHIILKTSDGNSIRFRFYQKEAPITSKTFIETLPLEVTGRQARTAGEEIWIPEGPGLNIIQENATVHLKPGELGIAPLSSRNEVERSIAIVYGEAMLHDCVNVFAKVFDEDVEILKRLGERIWLKGEQVLTFEVAND